MKYFPKQCALNRWKLSGATKDDWIKGTYMPLLLQHLQRDSIPLDLQF